MCRCPACAGGAQPWGRELSMHWAAILVWLQGSCLGHGQYMGTGFGLFGFGFGFYTARRSRSSGTHPSG